MNSPADKRRAPRAKRDSVLELHDKQGHLIIGVGRLVNFSATGACFASTHVLKQGELIHANLRLLKEGRLHISGHIVWIRRKTNTILYGLEFDSIRKK
jgi:hypothetical protein